MEAQIKTVPVAAPRCVVRLATSAHSYASAEHLQLASSARGVLDGLSTANPIAAAIAIFKTVNIFLVGLPRAARVSGSQASGVPQRVNKSEGEPYSGL